MRKWLIITVFNDFEELQRTNQSEQQGQEKAGNSSKECPPDKEALEGGGKPKKPEGDGDKYQIPEPEHPAHFKLKHLMS